MQSKLDELAAKEEKLRLINDALDIKKNEVISGADNLEESKGGDYESSDNSDDQFKGKNLGAGGRFQAAADAIDDEDSGEDYGDGNFENNTEGNNTSSSKYIKAAAAAPSNPLGQFEMKMDDDDDIAAAVMAGRRASAAAAAGDDMSDEELKSGMYAELKRKYQDLLSDHREQDKTINFQKAKIAALQTELEESLQSQAEQKTQIDMSEKADGKAQEVDKKAADKINQLNLQASKLKNQITAQGEKIKDYERTLADTNKEIDG